MSNTWTLTARWIFPVAAAPLERGTITLRDDRIVAVEPHGTRTADQDLGNVALLPGFVNAHTHLDLSGMAGQCPPTPDFTAWLQGVIRFRRGRTAEDVRADVQRGIDESLRSGTTLLGDISGEGTSWSSLAGARLRAIVYREWIGLTQERLRQAKYFLPRWMTDHGPTPTCKPGISPHAPYSVHTSLIDLTCTTGLPFCIHLAETSAELELLAYRRGPFVSFLCELGAWNPEGLAPSINSILVRTRRANHPLYVHANYLPPDAPIPSHGTIVYCPRTHAAFGHSPHPFRAFLARGVRVALGTDSLASNPDLSVLAEARFVHAQYPDVAGATVLRLVTLSGAEALGWAEETGSLTPGKSADLVVLPLPDEERADPHELVLQSAQPVRAVLFRGEWTVGGP